MILRQRTKAFLVAGVSALAVVLLPGAPPQPRETAQVWTVVELAGRAEVRASAFDSWRGVLPEEPLPGDWMLRTPAGGGAVLRSGSNLVELASGSYLTAETTGPRGLRTDPFLTLRRGIAVFDLGGADLRIVTPFFTVDPRGTQFVLEVANRHGAMTVGEGALDVSYGLGDAALTVRTGETVVVDLAKGTVERASAAGSDSARSRDVARAHRAWLQGPLGRLAARDGVPGEGPAGSALAPALAGDQRDGLDEPGGVDSGIVTPGGMPDDDPTGDMADDDLVGTGSFDMPDDDDVMGGGAADDRFPGDDPPADDFPDDDGFGGGDGDGKGPPGDDGPGPPDDFPDDFPDDDIFGDDDSSADDDRFPDGGDFLPGGDDDSSDDHSADDDSSRG